MFGGGLIQREHYVYIYIYGYIIYSYLQQMRAEPRTWSYETEPRYVLKKSIKLGEGLLLHPT